MSSPPFASLGRLRGSYTRRQQKRRRIFPTPRLDVASMLDAHIQYSIIIFMAIIIVSYHSDTRFLLILDSAGFLSPRKISSANTLLISPGENRGILEGNANTQKRQKSSKIRHSRGVEEPQRRTLFGTPKRQAVGSNPAGCANLEEKSPDLEAKRV